MSDDKNIPGENLKEQIQNSNEESASENIQQEQTLDQTETTNPKSEIQKSEIENMEVHHHPNLHHRKKHWKEYFLEFLMIFLAVTMGFFAENLREHIKDDNEIHENIQSVLADLKSDVVHFNAILDMNIYGYSAADSLISLLHNNIASTTQIYFYARVATANVGYFYTNSKTFEQMKTAGMLKLIYPQNLLDSLGFYYVTFQLLSQQDEVVRKTK